MKPSRLFLLGCLSTFLMPSPLSAAESSIDPKALEPLKRMSATLAAAKAFTYRSEGILEVPAKNGQFITLFSNARVALQRPNKLSAQLGGEAPHFDFYYDGATVSAFAPATKVFSTAKAPGTIDEMLFGLESETGIRFITAPLYLSNPYAAMTRGLQSAIVVGPATVSGAECLHLAFRSPGVNWELWVENGPRALPRRLAVTFTDRPNFPRTLIKFSHWNLSPWLTAGNFVFRKPNGATEIPFASVYKSTGR